jgi:hypothetical protein
LWRRDDENIVRAPALAIYQPFGRSVAGRLFVRAAGIHPRSCRR